MAKQRKLSRFTRFFRGIVILFVELWVVTREGVFRFDDTRKKEEEKTNKAHRSETEFGERKGF